MKSINHLTKEDYIAFDFRDKIIVSDITKIYSDKVLVHFLEGYKSESEFVEKGKILAIGNNETGEGRIKGWGGKYDILNQEEIDKLLIQEFR